MYLFLNLKKIYIKVFDDSINIYKTIHLTQYFEVCSFIDKLFNLLFHCLSFASNLGKKPSNLFLTFKMCFKAYENVKENWYT